MTGPRGRPRGMQALAVAATALFVTGGCSGGFFAGTREVDCSRFAAFLDQPAMPPGITDATCTYEGFQDQHLTAEFDVTTLSELEDWLAELPASEPLDREQHDHVVEYAQIQFRPRLDGGADCLDVSAVETADGFHVTMSAFNV